MGSSTSQVGFVDLGTLWDKVPAGGEVIITRDKITISDCPRLDIGKGVLHSDFKPSTYGQLMVSLSDLQYGDDSDAVLSPNIRVNTKKHEEKIRGSIGDYPTNQTMGATSEFIPELTAVGLYQNSTQGKEDPPVSFLTPETQSDESDEYSAGFNEHTDSLYQLPALKSEGQEYMSELSPTMNFTTRSIAEENMRDLQNFLNQHLSSSPSIGERNSETKLGQDISLTRDLNEMNNEDKVAVVRVERDNCSVLKTEDGVILSKKLATQLEQKGMRECHVYFTPRTSAEIWPPLIVTVGEDWDFVKVMRKSIANLQRCINRGERDGTHDWLFDYHPNKDIKKIKKDLKLLFGPKVISFRGSHLKKSVKDISGDFINKMWILQNQGDRNHKGRKKGSSQQKSIMNVRSPKSKKYTNKRAKSFHQKKSRNSRPTHYSRISHRL